MYFLYIFIFKNVFSDMVNINYRGFVFKCVRTGAVCMCVCVYLCECTLEFRTDSSVS